MATLVLDVTPPFSSPLAAPAPTPSSTAPAPASTAPAHPAAPVKVPAAGKGRATGKKKAGSGGAVGGK